MRSAIAASLLINAGYDVVNLSGGFGAWSHAGLPAETAAPACQAAPARRPDAISLVELAPKAKAAKMLDITAV